MTAAEGNVLFETLLLRNGCAATDGQMETLINKYLTALLIELDSTEKRTRIKVLCLLVQLNICLKNHSNIQLPVDDLMRLFGSPCISSIVNNFVVMYIKMGFLRLELSQQAKRVPTLISYLDGKTANHRDILLHLIMPALEYVQCPQSVEERQEKYQFINNPNLIQLFLLYALELVMVPYGSHTKIAQLQKSATRKPFAAPSGELAPEPPTAPPGMSITSFKRVMGEQPYESKQLERIKLGIIHFLGLDIVPANEIVPHYIVATADLSPSVATAAEKELQKILPAVDFNNISLVHKLFNIFLGTLDLKGQPIVKPELRRTAACVRMRLKIFPHLLKTNEAGRSFPFNIQTLFDCLFRKNKPTNAKLKIYALQLLHAMCSWCEDPRFEIISPILHTKLVNFIKAGKEDQRVVSLAFVAIGKLVKKFPQFVPKNICLVQIFFCIMYQANPPLRGAVEEALMLMAEALRNLDESSMKTLEAVLFKAIHREEPYARMMAVRYASRVFPTHHVGCSYILLLSSGDAKKEISCEALKALAHRLGSKSLEEPERLLPDFVAMVKYIKEKADVCSTSQKWHGIGNSTLAFNPLVYGVIMVFLRSCLAHSAGFKLRAQTIVSMKEQAPYIAKYVKSLLQVHRQETGPVQTYVMLLKGLFKVAAGLLYNTVLYCLLEIVAMAPKKLVPRLVNHLGWLKTCIFSTREEARDIAANLYSIIICRQPCDIILEAVDFFQVSLLDKGVEVQHGSMLALGYLIVEILKHSRHQKNTHFLWQKMEKRFGVAVKSIARLVKVSEENNPVISIGACLAIGEIGRNVALPLPPGREGQSEKAVTKLSLVKNLVAIIKSEKEAEKNKKIAALCLAYLCVGEEKFCHHKLAIMGLLTSVTLKELRVHFTFGEALLYAAQGFTSPARRDLWTETEQEFQQSVGSSTEDEVSFYLDNILSQEYVTSTDLVVQQASSIWLLILIKKCSLHPAVHARLMDVQTSYVQLLAKNNELTQDITAKILWLAYEFGSSEQKQMMVSRLMDTLMIDECKQSTSLGDPQQCEEGSPSNIPEIGYLSTYKELCYIANEVHQPDLIFTFMCLANHQVLWRTKKAVSFGFDNMTFLARLQLTPYLSQIVPVLHKYQFDPDLKIQQALTRVWNALVPEDWTIVNEYRKDVWADTLVNLRNNRWRMKSASCLAVYELLRGPLRDEVIELLSDLWEACLNLFADSNKHVLKAANFATAILSVVTVKFCDVSLGDVGEWATALVVPCLLRFSIPNPIKLASSFGVATLKIICNNGRAIKPHIPIMVMSFLDAINCHNQDVLAYYSSHISGDINFQHKFEVLRSAATRMCAMIDLIDLCVFYIDDTVLPKLIPMFTEFVQTVMVLTKKAACASFVISLIEQCPNEVSIYAENLILPFLIGVADSDTAVRKFYATTIGHLVGIAEDSCVQSLIIRMRSWYLEKEEAVHIGCGLILHAINQFHYHVLEQHSLLVMPLVFLAMHEQTTVCAQNDSDNISSLWEDIWKSNTLDTEVSIKVFLAEIIDLVLEAFKSPTCSAKSQAARVISTVAEKQGAILDHTYLTTIISALLEELHGENWAGKECLLHAIEMLCKSCSECLQADCGDVVLKIAETVLEESKNEDLKYKLKALTCLGVVLEIFSIDQFVEVFSIFSQAFEEWKKMEVDGVIEEKINSKIKLQLVCYFTVLGQAWPQCQATQDEYMEKVCCVLCETLQSCSWTIQEAILKAMHKYITRLHTLKDIDTFKENEFATKTVLERILLSLSTSLGNFNCTPICTDALTIVENVVPKLTELGILSILSQEVSDKLQSDLNIMYTDAGPELHERSAQLLKIINI